MGMLPDPRRLAADLKKICDTAPGFEWGALGPENVLRLALSCLQKPDLAEAGVKLAFFAFADHPLHPDLLHFCAAVLGEGGKSEPRGRIIEALRKVCARPAEAEIPEELRGSEAKDLLRAVSPLLKGGHRGFWLREGVNWCLRHDSGPEVLESLLESFPPLAELGDLDRAWRDRIRAGMALARFEPAGALLFLRQHQMPGFEAWRDLRMADCLARINRPGCRDEALRLLWPVWRAVPWHPNLILALHNLRFPLPAVPPGGELPPILLYSWNKRDILAGALRSLLATEAAGAPVLVLDNGSTDGTGEMLRSMAENFSGGLKQTTLPVNIGAPPARNWLLARPEARAAKWAVFLDDDLVLSPGWLNAMLEAAAANPGAGNIGCAITDHTPPHFLQSADFFALPSQLGQRSFTDLEENIFIHCGGAGGLDTLLTRYTRPCLSVSGCCHMIRTDKVAEIGGFDIRFNPSQFDDLERDLRLALAGAPVLYTGNVPIRHVQHSSLRQTAGKARSAHIFGNKIKLEFLYPPVKVNQMREFSLTGARLDLLRKSSQLATASIN